MTAPSSLAWAVEEACNNAFPALRQALCGGWLVRASGSTRRTANSATPLPQEHSQAEVLIGRVEAVYGGIGQRPIFRIPSFLDSDVDDRLAGRGYTDEGHSCVIHGPIGAVAAAGGDKGNVRLLPKPTAEWLAAMVRLQRQSEEEHAAYRRVLGSILVPAAFAAVESEGAIAALAFGAIHRGLLCYELVVVDPQMRRRGFGRRVLAGLAAWARDREAIGACLQVEVANTPARTLYHAIGLTTELHRYHYRRPPRAG